MAASKKIYLMLSVVGTVVLIDQITKIWVRKYVAMYDFTELIPNFIDLTHFQNHGISFGALSSLPDGWRAGLIIGISVIALFFLYRYWCANCGSESMSCNIAILCIMGGAMGNLIDRVYFGYVTDFLRFRFYDVGFFVNNLADIFISLGLVAYIIGVVATERNRRQATLT